MANASSVSAAPSKPGFDQTGGKPTWPLDRYLDEGERVTDWFASGVVKQHRTIATYVNVLTAAGLQIVAMDEWGPSEDQLALHPEWAVERDRPPFLLMACQKSSLDGTLVH